MQDSLLTIREVAQILKISVATVYQYIHKDLIRAVKLSRDYRIDSKDLKEFINNRKN